MKYAILAISLVGNKKDGFEINDMEYTRDTVEVPNTATDKEVIKLVRKACGHRADARGYFCSINDEYHIAIDCSKTGQPCYRAERCREELLAERITCLSIVM